MNKEISVHTSMFKDNLTQRGEGEEWISVSQVSPKFDPKKTVLNITEDICDPSIKILPNLVKASHRHFTETLKSQVKSVPLVCAFLLLTLIQV